MRHLKIRGILGAACVAATLSFAPTAASATCYHQPNYEHIKSELVVLISVLEGQIDKYPPRSAIGRFLRHKLRSSNHLLARLERHTEYGHRYNRRNKHRYHNVRGRICQPQVSKW